MEGKNVTVVVCTYGRAPYLDRCLRSIDRLDYPHHTLVVYKPDGDEQLVRAILDEHHVEMVTQANTGIAAARNLGVVSAETEYVAFVDDDCTVDPDWLSAMVARLEMWTGGVAGSARGADGRPEFSGGYVDMYGRYKMLCDPPSAYTGPDGPRYNNMVGMSCILHRDSVLAVGGFDEYFNGFYEETDLAVRLITNGLPLVSEPRAVVHHYSADGPRRRGRWEQDWYTIARNSTYMPYKNFHDHTAKRTAILAYMHARRMVSYGIALARGQVGPARCVEMCTAATRGYADGLRDAMRKRK